MALHRPEVGAHPGRPRATGDRAAHRGRAGRRDGSRQRPGAPREAHPGDARLVPVAEPQQHGRPGVPTFRGEGRTRPVARGVVDDAAVRHAEGHARQLRAPREVDVLTAAPVAVVEPADGEEVGPLHREAPGEDAGEEVHVAVLDVGVRERDGPVRWCPRRGLLGDAHHRARHDAPRVARPTTWRAPRWARRGRRRRRRAPSPMSSPGPRRCGRSRLPVARCSRPAGCPAGRPTPPPGRGSRPSSRCRRRAPRTAGRPPGPGGTRAAAAAWRGR